MGGRTIRRARALPTVREFGEGAPRKIAQAFGRLSWPAFWLLVATGVWNYLAINHADASASWNAVFGVKMILVVVAGVGTFMHTKATSPEEPRDLRGCGCVGFDRGTRARRGDRGLVRVVHER